MTKYEVFDLMNGNPAFFLATVEGKQPRVRGMLLYKADEEGILFHTGTMKEIYQQVMANPQVELCFNDFKLGVQLRVFGELTLLCDKDLKDEIADHPSRAFLKPWRESGKLEDFYNSFAVFSLKNGIASTWTMATNFDEKEKIYL